MAPPKNLQGLLVFHSGRWLEYGWMVWKKRRWRLRRERRKDERAGSAHHSGAKIIQREEFVTTQKYAVLHNLDTHSLPPQPLHPKINFYSRVAVKIVAEGCKLLLYISHLLTTSFAALLITSPNFLGSISDQGYTQGSGDHPTQLVSIFRNILYSFW
jgi:hypothetical protein